MNKCIAILVLAGGCTSQGPSQTPPPSWGVPISGGNVLIAASGHAWVADPDRDRVVDVDLALGTSVEIALQPGDEPGRLVEDGAGRIHVALRRGGALVTFASDQIAARRAVCGEPRGLAYDATTDVVHVACTGGELVTFPAAGGDAVRTVRLDRDLRDVLISGGQLYVTRFRAAEVLALDANGAVVNRIAPPIVQRLAAVGGLDVNSDGTVNAIPAVAWRTIALPNGTFLMSHQRQVQGELTVEHGGYGNFSCGNGTDESALAWIHPAAGPATMPAIDAIAAVNIGALPVDIAVDSRGTQIAVVSAGNQTIQTASSEVFQANDDNECGASVDRGTINDELGAPTSVAFTATGELVIYYPEFPALVVHDGDSTARTIQLPGDFGYDSGRALFHTETQVGLACASCHPEARDDGLVWTFQNEGTRRTQNLSGQILARAPYHWAGDEPDLPTLMDDVFAVRMAGPQPTHSQHSSLGLWLNRVPAPAPVPAIDGDAAARGKTLFESTDVGCVTCHTGPLMSTKAIVDVGTGGKFKVPSLLGVGNRAPFLHDGCAATLTDRFGQCGGGDQHGKTSQLTPAQISDLVAYLGTL